MTRYTDVVQHLLGCIREGALLPGARVLSEGELAAAFGVSKVTADRALRELARMGAINRVPRVGSFVAKTQCFSLNFDFPDIAHETLLRREVHSVEVIALEEVVTPREIALEMGESYPSLVFRSLIAHLANMRRTHIEERFVDPSAAPGYLQMNFLKGKTAQYLRQRNSDAKIVFRIEAVIPQERERALLNMAPNEPCLAICDKFIRRDGEAISVARLTSVQCCTWRNQN
ncbi:GntR family histidine utilization transcriptional repressor [Rhizobium sp. PP-F2F-G20b]|nr:GntR family histidine utilization transcriptional repressor [Rhizobium sp. PP-F2F-G20b]